MGERTDATGAAYAGSQLQTQLWVNVHPEQLAGEVEAVFSDLDAETISWVSPLRAESFREYHDAAFLRHAGLDHLIPQLSAFWPRGGPVWDGLGYVEDDHEQTGVILLEGKSYPGELYGGGCQAGEKSRKKITDAIGRTQAWLGVTQTPEQWCGPLYQTANRLAHLYWLNEIVGVRAWFVHLLFTGDPRSPTTAQQWETAIAKADHELGLAGPVTRAGHVCLPAGDRTELVGSG